SQVHRSADVRAATFDLQEAVSRLPGCQEHNDVGLALGPATGTTSEVLEPVSATQLGCTVDAHDKIRPLGAPKVRLEPHGEEDKAQSSAVRCRLDVARAPIAVAPEPDLLLAASE